MPEKYPASKPYEICFKRANERIYSGKPFSLGELQDYILEDKEAVLRILPGFTLGDYVSELEEDNVINLNTKMVKFELKKDLIKN